MAAGFADRKAAAPTAAAVAGNEGDSVGVMGEGATGAPPVLPAVMPSSSSSLSSLSAGIRDAAPWSSPSALAQTSSTPLPSLPGSPPHPPPSTPVAAHTAVAPDDTAGSGSDADGEAADVGAPAVSAAHFLELAALAVAGKRGRDRG